MKEKINSNEQEETDSEMDFWEHIGELRKRLIYSAVAIGIGAIFGWFYSEKLFHILSEPFIAAFPEGELIGTGPAEAFILRLKLAVFSGALLATPVIFAQIWFFIAPGLLENEKKLALPFIVFTTLFFLTGAWFCYAIVLPFALDFFQQQYNKLGVVKPTIRISEYLAVFMKATLGFGLAYETPVFAFILGKLGLITDKTLLSAGRYAIILIFIASAILTPPDILTQFLMAGPLILLYGLSILIVRYTGRKGVPSESSSQ